MICLVRVDDRLLHGQVIHAWVPFTGADMLVVVTDSDASALIEKDLSALASESGCELRVITPDYAGGFLSDPALDRRRVIVLFSSIEEASRSYKMGFDFTALNIGNIHHAAFKKKLSPSAVITEEEERELEGLCSSGVTLDVRVLPEAKESRV